MTSLRHYTTIPANARLLSLQVAKIAKAVSDTPCGGEIIITGETMAAIASMAELTEQARAQNSGLLCRVIVLCVNGQGWMAYN